MRNHVGVFVFVVLTESTSGYLQLKKKFAGHRDTNHKNCKNADEKTSPKKKKSSGLFDKQVDHMALSKCCQLGRIDAN